MKREFQYRDYTVYHDGHEFVAEVTAAEEIPDDTEVFEIGSPLLDNVIRAIDELYDAVESGTTPEWFSKWLAEGVAERARAPATVVVDPEGEFVLSGKDADLVRSTAQSMIMTRRWKRLHALHDFTKKWCEDIDPKNIVIGEVPNNLWLFSPVTDS